MCVSVVSVIPACMSVHNTGQKMSDSLDVCSQVVVHHLVHEEPNLDNVLE